MESVLPTPEQVKELITFLPKLYADDLLIIKRWGGGETPEDGSFTMHWPEYDQVVSDFFRIAGTECWSDYNYIPDEAGKMLDDHEGIASANISQIKTMLTFCVRGERFCDGHWAAMIEQGHIRRLLQRLSVLNSTLSDKK